MTESAITYVTDDMHKLKGVWIDERTSPPISMSDIRKWAIATYWPEQPPRIYWDEPYAEGTRWGGILAPPDFNPFAWPVERIARADIPQPRKTDGSRFTGMNGGQTDTYGAPMRSGDVITARSRLSDWHERDGRIGWTLYTTTEIEWRNQNDEHVKTRMSIGIRY